MKISEILIAGAVVIGGVYLLSRFSSGATNAPQITTGNGTNSTDGGFGDPLSQLFGFLGDSFNNSVSTNSGIDAGNGTGTGESDYSSFDQSYPFISSGDGEVTTDLGTTGYF